MFQGSIVALVTPMKADETVDYDALERLVEFHCENGTNAIVSVGTTGESATLSFEEHAKVIKRTIEYVHKRIPVIAGTGANSTIEAIHLTESAQIAGADACLLVSPYYNKPTQEGLFLHHKKIAEAVNIPQILYNVPGRTAVDMLPDTVVRLAALKNIIGIKEATGDLNRSRELIDRLQGKIAVYTGDDATAMECILQGARGNISVTANVTPKLMAQMCAAAIAGDREQAQQFDEKMRDLHRELFCQSNPIPVKWALTAMGKIGGTMRLPLTPLAAQYHQQVRQALENAGVL